MYPSCHSVWPPPLGLDLACLSWCPGDAEEGREVVGKGTASEADDGGEPAGGAEAPSPATPPAGAHRHPAAPTPRAARSVSTGRATT